MLDFGSSRYPVTYKINELLQRVDKNVLSRVPTLEVGLLDGVVIGLMATFMALIVQGVISNIFSGDIYTTHNHEHERSGKDNIAFNGISCLMLTNEADFDHCVRRW